jgi:hypothetical protein
LKHYCVSPLILSSNDRRREQDQRSSGTEALVARGGLWRVAMADAALRKRASGVARSDGLAAGIVGDGVLPSATQEPSQSATPEPSQRKARSWLAQM